MPRIFLILLLGLLPLFAVAQDDVQFDHLTMKDGLSMNPVMAMDQDQRGFLWFGTQDGLNRYDGYSFKVYKTNDADTNSISDNFITGLDATYPEYLWVGTLSGGLNKFDFATNHFTHFAADPKRPEGLRSNRIWCMVRFEMQLWIGTDSGITIYDDFNRRFMDMSSDYPFLNQLKKASVLSIFRDRTGTFWIGTTAGLYRCRGTTCQLYRHDDATASSLSNDIVLSIYQDMHGNMWIGTVDGLNKYDPKTDAFEIYTFRKDLEPVVRGKQAQQSAIQNTYSIINNYGGNTIRCMLEDDRGRLWIGTDLQLVVFNTTDGSFVSYRKDISNPTSISGQFMRSMMLDRSGNLWIGTLANGLNRTSMNPKKFGCYQKRLDRPDGLAENYVRAFAEDSAGIIWTGTLVGGLNRFDPNTGSFTHYDKSNSSIGDDNVWSLVYDSTRNCLWAGTNNGLDCYDIATQKFTVYFYDKDDSSSLSENTVRCVFVDRQGMVWAGTEGGMNRLDPATGKFKRYTITNSGLSNNTVWKITADKNGIFWLTTNDGFDRFDPSTGTFKVYRKQAGKINSLSHNNCRTVFIDSQQSIWVGTQNGLNKFDPKTGSFTRFDEKNGLPNNFIYAIQEDARQNLWISTNKGLCRMSITNGRCVSYDAYDGLQDDEFNTNASFRAKNGEMYFGGPSGFNRFNPEQMSANTFMPPVLVTNIRVMNVPLVSDTDVTTLKTLTLNYDQNLISFDFASLDFTNPSRNHYAYKLEGFDKSWVYSGAQHSVTYTNLDPGEYIFMARGTNSDGVWSTNVVEIHVRILPPFWRTYWFYAVSAVTLLLLIYLVYRWRVRQLQREKVVLEKKVQERTHDLEAANRELEQLSLVASRSDNAIVITDPQGKIEWVNESVRRKNRLATDDGLIGASLFDASTNNNIRDLVDEAIRLKRSVVYESFILSSEGQRYWVSSTLTPIFEPGGKLRKLIIVDSDITERKQAEEIIRQKNKDITDSINYARRIQQAILPDMRRVRETLPGAFVFYQPRDIVSGDFYFFHRAENFVIWAVVDCTGHGVPGAFMSMIGNELLMQIVADQHITSPARALEELDRKLGVALNQTEQNEDSEIRDGMDIALCALNLDTMQLQFAGAHRPLVIVSDGKLAEYKSAKCSIGGFTTGKKVFEDTTITLKKKDVVYLFTDGIADQFGGSRGKKYKHRNLLRLFETVYNEGPEVQRQILQQTIDTWRGSLEQVDDMLVFGVRI